MTKQKTIVPVIMSGGAGTRLWPLSKRDKPKQLHAISTDRSLLQETALRVPQDCGFTAPVVVCAEHHIRQVREQFDEIGIQPTAIIAEPCPRNTAPCAMVAALAVAEKFGDDALVLLLAADHHIAKPQAFREAVRDGASSAATHILTFGPRPTRPETGYGYILGGQPLAGNVLVLEKFVEKPDLPTAKKWVKDGRYLWNSGMFLFAAGLMINEMIAHRPKISGAAKAAWTNAKTESINYVLDPVSFADCPSESVDTAIMENTDKGAVLPLDIGWSDVGSWTAIQELGEADEHGNVCTGRTISIDNRDCLFRGDGIRVAAAGLENMAVIATPKAVLILPLDQAQKVRDIVDLLDPEEL